MPLVCLRGCRLRAVAKGPVRACACLCVRLWFFMSSPEWMWMSSTVSMVAKSQKKNAHNGKMPEKTLVMLVIITQQTRRLFAPGLYLLFRPPPPALDSCSLSLTMIKKCGPRREQVSRETHQKRAQGSRRQHRFGTRGQMKGSVFVSGQHTQTVLNRLKWGLSAGPTDNTSTERCLKR